MGRKESVQNVEELHQTSRNVLGQGIGALEWHGAAESAHPAVTQRGFKRGPCRCLTHPEKPRGQGIKVEAIELVELAAGIDKNSALLRQSCLVVVANGIMAEIVENFQCQKEARGMHVGVPVENGRIDDLHVSHMPGRIDRVLQALALELREIWRYLYDLELGSMVHVMVSVADEIQDVEHQRAIPCTHLIYDQVMVRVQGQLVVRDEISSNCFSVVGTK